MLPARLTRYDALIDYLVELLVQEFDAAQAAASVGVVSESSAAAELAHRVSDDARSEDRPGERR